jgi:hypothetical protein
MLFILFTHQVWLEKRICRVESVIPERFQSKQQQQQQHRHHPMPSTPKPKKETAVVPSSHQPQSQPLVHVNSLSALEPLPPVRSFDWLTSFPSPDDLEAFITNSVQNASIARTCLKEAKETKALLQEAVGRGEVYVLQCDARIKQRQKSVAAYQTEVNKLRARVDH